MSEIMAILIPTGIIALIWVIFESAALKGIKKMDKSSNNKGGNETKFKKEGNVGSIDSQKQPERKILREQNLKARRRETHDEFLQRLKGQSNNENNGKVEPYTDLESPTKETHEEFITRLKGQSNSTDAFINRLKGKSSNKNYDIDEHYKKPANDPKPSPIVKPISEPEKNDDMTSKIHGMLQREPEDNTSLGSGTDSESESHMNEEEIYELIAEEIESNSTKKGLWTKAFSVSEGDEQKTKALYIKYRFDQIKDV